MTLLHARAWREELHSPGCDRMQWITTERGLAKRTRANERRVPATSFVVSSHRMCDDLCQQLFSNVRVQFLCPGPLVQLRLSVVVW